MRYPDDAQSIGLILCKEKSQIIAEDRPPFTVEYSERIIERGSLEAYKPKCLSASNWKQTL
jgi:hypothetical protein